MVDERRVGDRDDACVGVDGEGAAGGEEDGLVVVVVGEQAMGHDVEDVGRPGQREVVSEHTGGDAGADDQASEHHQVQTEGGEADEPHGVEGLEGDEGLRLEAYVPRLKEDGCDFVGPASGDLACGYEGIGRMAEVGELLKAVAHTSGV